MVASIAGSPHHRDPLVRPSRASPRPRGPDGDRGGPRRPRRTSPTSLRASARGKRRSGVSFRSRSAARRSPAAQLGSPRARRESLRATGPVRRPGQRPRRARRAPRTGSSSPPAWRTLRRPALPRTSECPAPRASAASARPAPSARPRTAGGCRSRPRRASRAPENRAVRPWRGGSLATRDLGRSHRRHLDHGRIAAEARGHPGLALHHCSEGRRVGDHGDHQLCRTRRLGRGSRRRGPGLDQRARSLAGAVVDRQGVSGAKQACRHAAAHAAQADEGNRGHGDILTASFGWPASSRPMRSASDETLLRYERSARLRSGFTVWTSR